MEIPPRKKSSVSCNCCWFQSSSFFFFFFTTQIWQVVLPKLCCRLAISRRESRTGHMLRMQELLTIHLAIPPTSLVCSTKCNKSQNTWCDVGTQGEEAISSWVAWVSKNEDTDSDDYILSSSFRGHHFFSWEWNYQLIPQRHSMSQWFTWSSDHFCNRVCHSCCNNPLKTFANMFQIWFKQFIIPVH